MLTLTGMGIVGGRKGGVASSSVARMPQSMTQSTAGRPTWADGSPPAYVPVGGKGGGWGIRRPQEASDADSKKGGKSMVDEIGEITEGKGLEKDREETVLRKRTEEAMNAKKRMYEQQNVNAPQKRDEL